MASNRDASHAAGLVLLRVFLGLVLTINGWHDVGAHEPLPRDLHAVVTAAVPEAPAPLSWIGEGVLAKQPALFAWLARWGQLVAGLALLLGALVRPAGWLACTGFLLAYFLGRPEQAHWNLMAAVCCATCALTTAGHRFGLDGVLDDALPGWLTWRPGGASSRKSPFG